MTNTSLSSYSLLSQFSYTLQARMSRPRRLTNHNMKKIALSVKVIVFTMHDDAEYIGAMLSLGAKGYVLKSTSPCELIRAIEVVHGGNVFLSPQVSNALVLRKGNPPRKPTNDVHAQLTSRERQLLEYVAEGKSTKDIAVLLAISPRTVEGHKSRLMQKLGAHTQHEMIKCALKQREFPTR